MKCYVGIILSITSTMAAKIWNKRDFPFDWSYDENLVLRTSLWPNGVVPYILDDGFSSVEMKKIDKSMRDIESKTCIKFIKRRQTDYYYLRIVKREKGCWSWVGLVYPGQPLNLADRCFLNKGTIIHELMHTLGFKHEQSRP